MTNQRDEIDAGLLDERIEALPGISRLREAAGELDAYLVGGAVRDLLLGEERADLDVVVEEGIGPLAERLGGEVREYERFATATVSLDDMSLDLATSRAEAYDHAGALPRITPAPLADDLARRDFTINAMAVPLAGEPQLIDPHGGLADLQGGLLRVLHENSFRDDPTRALRAARYAARLGFELEEKTAALLREADLSTVSADRVEAELRRIAAEEDPGKAFALARQWGVLSGIDDEGSERATAVARLSGQPPWAGWVNRELAVMLAVVRPLDQSRELAAAEPATPSEAVRLASPWDPSQLILARAMGGGQWLERYAAEWRDVELEIDGADLIEAGVPEGPAVGRGLEAALDAKLDSEAEGREAELAVALKAARA